MAVRRGRGNLGGSSGTSLVAGTVGQGVAMTKMDNPRVFVPPPLIFGGLLLIGLLVDRSKETDALMQIAGVATGLTGLALIAVALGLFRSSKTRPEPWQPTSALVVSGIFRMTRNPMYLGMAVLSLGIALFFASLPAVLLTALAVLIIDRWVIAREEAYLTRRFGEPYAAYRRKVRRWL